MKRELQFRVERVIDGSAPTDNAVEAVQVDNWAIPYAKSSLVLRPISDDELKQFGPGQTLKVTVEA